MPTCNGCGGNNIDFDPSRGSAVCTNCGCVLEDSIIVSEVSFADNNSGGSSVVGQFVSAEGSKGYSVGPGFQHGYGRESREVTLTNGRRKIAGLAASLRLNSHHVDAAQQFFKLAVQRNFIQGRKTNHVVAACLYIVCRTEQTPHMLLDFSDVLQINVYMLGATFLKLCQVLSIRLPIIDPSLYIFRFAHKLEFEEKTHDVAMSALRLVARMKRDWMQVGRRPSGICGAGLLIAARLHGFHRTKKEIIDTVRICEVTLRKRLEEFEVTPSGNLTTEEFQNIDLEEECDPPSFTVSKKKSMKQKEAPADAAHQEASNQEESQQQAGKNCTNGNQPDLDSIEEEMLQEMHSAEFQEMNEPKSSSGIPSTQLSFREMNASSGCGFYCESEASEHLGPENLSDVDDKELDIFFLNDQEIQVKTQLWTEMNKEYLELQIEKEKQEAADRAMGITRKTKRKRKKPTCSGKEPPENALDAFKKMIAVKKISKKINYDVLQDLNDCFQKPFPIKKLDKNIPFSQEKIKSSILTPHASNIPLNSPLASLPSSDLKNADSRPQTISHPALKPQTHQSHPESDSGSESDADENEPYLGAHQSVASELGYSLPDHEAEEDLDYYHDDAIDY